MPLQGKRKEREQAQHLGKSLPEVAMQGRGEEEMTASEEGWAGVPALGPKEVKESKDD